MTLQVVTQAELRVEDPLLVALLKEELSGQDVKQDKSGKETVFTTPDGAVLNKAVEAIGKKKYTLNEFLILLSDNDLQIGKKKAGGGTRRRRSPEEIALEKAQKDIKAKTREALGMDPKGAVPKDKREAYEKKLNELAKKAGVKL